MSTKPHLAGGEEKLTDSFCAVFAPQGSFATRTAVRPLMEKLTAWRGTKFKHKGWDAIVFDTLEVGMLVELKSLAVASKTDPAERAYFINCKLAPECQVRSCRLSAES